MRRPLLGWGGPSKADPTPEALGGVNNMHETSIREETRHAADSYKFFGGADGDQRAD